VKIQGFWSGILCVRRPDPQSECTTVLCNFGKHFYPTVQGNIPKRLESSTTQVWEHHRSPNKPHCDGLNWLSLLFYEIYVATHSYITSQCEKGNREFDVAQVATLLLRNTPRGILHPTFMFHESRTDQTFNSYSWHWRRKRLKNWDSKTNDTEMLSFARVYSCDEITHQTKNSRYILLNSFWTLWGSGVRISLWRSTIATDLKACSQNCEKRMLASSCLSVCLSVRPSVCPHGITRLPLSGFL
jgi:hypothetical protein